MKGTIVALAVLGALLVAGLVLPGGLVGSGIGDFEGRQRKAARVAFFYVATYYGESFLEYGEYIGPPLVLGWRIEGVEECPGEPTRKEVEGNSYRALVGARATVEAYTLFGVPRGKVDVTCEGRRNWDPYF